METARSNKLVPILVILLVVASFLIGSLYTRVNLLEKSAGTQAAAGGQVAGTGTNQPQALEPTPSPVDIEVGNMPVQGNQNAKVAIVEFTDYQCPYCERLFSGTFPQVKKDYIDTGKVKYFVMDFPLTQIHAQAQKAAEAANCAEEQGKFWEMHDKIFNNQSAIGVDDLKKYAGELGLNTSQFNSCLDDGKYADSVKKEQQAGEKYGVQGTPASFVGIVSGNTVKQAIQVSGAIPFETFKSTIEDVIKKT